MPDTHARKLEPWQWPEAHWRKLVNQVRAGRTLPARRRGRTARAAPSRCRSIPTTRPTSCATAASRSAAWPGASTATASACRASCKLLREARRARRPSTCRPCRALLHPDEQRARGRRGPRDRHPRLDPRAATRCCRYEAERDLMMRSADTLEKITGKRAGRHAHAVVGLQPQHARASARSWGCSTTPR